MQEEDKRRVKTVEQVVIGCKEIGGESIILVLLVLKGFRRLEMWRLLPRLSRRMLLLLRGSHAKYVLVHKCCGEKKKSAVVVLLI